jgi:hypothetical protein
MNKALLDLYADYLLSSFSYTTATGLAKLLDHAISHDQITRYLAAERQTSASWWQLVKPLVREVEQSAGVLIFDDSIEEKPYTDENDIICWHYDHAQDRNVKGINFLTALYQVGEVSLPVAFHLVAKTEPYVDAKTGRTKRRSPTTKNEVYRDMLRICVQNHLQFRYVLNDAWYASADNMQLIKAELHKDFIMALKSNRKVALSSTAKQQGHYQAVNTLTFVEGTPLEVYLEQLDFPVLLAQQVFTNEDGRVPTGRGVLYLVTSDLTLDYDRLTTIYQTRWKVEEYHRSLKQNASLAQSPTRTVTTQTNHFFAALYAFVKLEMLKRATKLNHYALKTKLYLSALQAAFLELRKFQPISLPTTGFAA